MINAPQVLTVLVGNPLVSALFILLFVVVLTSFVPRRKEKSSVSRHRRYRANAERVFHRLSGLRGDVQRIGCLRKINPYVFEELLLLAFERQRHAIKRNASYSDDGGIDGQVFINGKRYLIQAKRYGKSITPAHIGEFGELLNKELCEGFFIHTGRTGHMSRQGLRTYPHIHLISGQRLLDLLGGKDGWYIR